MTTVKEVLTQLNAGITDANCPAVLESKYDLIGKRKMNQFCDLGCSVSCLEEYLILKPKRGRA